MVNYEGSPELGYASKEQVLEFVEMQASLAEEAQLFSTRDPQKTAQFGTQVFNRMINACAIYPYHHQDAEPGTAITRIRGGDELISGSTFETGIVNPELSILINLDYFGKLLNGGWTEGDRADIKGKSRDTLKSFIEERRLFLGVAESR